MPTFQLSFSERAFCLIKQRKEILASHRSKYKAFTCLFCFTATCHLKLVTIATVENYSYLLAPWDPIITGKTENPINDNSGLSPSVVAKCNGSRIWELYLWISFILFHVHWSLTIRKYNAIKASTQLNSIAEVIEKYDLQSNF